MEFHISNELPTFEQFAQLHEDSGLLQNKKGNYTREQLFEAAKGSWFYTAIYHNNTLTAFGRMISDGVYQALICDVMVSPDMQGQGLGKKVIEELLQKCKDSGIQTVQLFSAKGKHSFYKKLGFQERDTDAPGMTMLI
ncbi:MULTISPECIES: GNAT family N-acetyltransferase [Bacillaceae]|uniref:GNAT family N-acetyltransferase n=1 Tax=Bacillaceae TaxID=186817 RepID=UPI001E43D786|nr:MULTISPECIES: GNAT family N-acetyltransferase [Bacillaceae]MCE4047737.1 GNAT family N-acetyltransferase [Bacillus sp. Au-Bac7]MCM3031184.1 GNAT family N-acetyltransferase [Niallia sp. MER 6]MDL0434761.1 GNAT family N-acetyltransferase [Niallia sp. SS-2023]UPO89415.1 GNAT family N-acetyltransferase [Niallia sp. Man26]